MNRIRSWLRNVLRWSATDDLLDEELRACVEILAAEKVRSGLDRREAMRQARLEIGRVEVIKDAVRNVRRAPRMDSIVMDFRYAARMLRKQPFMACAVVLTLGIGIGTPTSVISLLNGFVFRTPVSRDRDAFFRVIRADRRSSGVATAPQYSAFLSESRSVKELAAWSTVYLSAPLGRDEPRPVPGLLVSCNFFRVFGVDAPVAGRLLEPGDCNAGVPAAVVSERLWRSHFGGDPAVLGTSLHYGGVPITIVGVAAAPPIQRQAHDPDPDFVADLWFPYTSQPALKQVLTLLQGRDLLNGPSRHSWLEVAGLLQPGVSREAAAAELRLIEARLNAAALKSEVILTDGSRWAGRPLSMMGLSAMVLALPALLMLMACVNVAALLLTRAIGRQREMAVRLALGTSKARLVRMMLIESFLLSSLAALLSLVLVYSLPPMLVRFFGAELWFGPADALAPDWRVFAFLAVCGGVASVLSGLAPALESLNPHVAELLQGRRSLVWRGGAGRMRRVFVGIQVAASMVPLIAAMTFARVAARYSDPGVRIEGVLVAEIDGQQNRLVPLSSLADSVATGPGVESVAYAENPPLLREGLARVRIPGRAGTTFPLAASVSMDYFKVFGLPILAGRSFERRDAGPSVAPKPIVVSRQFALRFFGNANVLGEIVESGDASPERMTIIGICGDRVTGLAGHSSALYDGSMIYELADPSARSGFLLVKAKGHAAAMADPLRAVLRNLTGSAASVQTFESSLADKVAGVRRVETLLFVLGIGSLLLAVIGVVGIVSADASQRRKELAIRLALGAGPWDVRRRVVLWGFPPVPVGVLFGLLAAWGLLRFGESARILPLGSWAGDPSAYVAISLLLLATAVGTLFAVAYPAGRQNPIAMLREE